MSSFGNRRISIAAGCLVVTIILLFSSYRLSYRLSTTGPVTTQLPHIVSSPPISSQKAGQKAAAIVENRPLDNLIPIILHFSSVLGPEWQIKVFTSEGNMGMFSGSIPFQRQVSEGRFHVRELPADEALNTHASVSAFFTKPWFWEAMAPAEHVLMFQADSILCSRSSQRVEDFLEYDFVGAPVDSERGLGMGYNGGLSIRNRTKSLEIVTNFDWQVERHGDHSQGNVDYEDQWFSKKMREVGAHLPTTEVAMRFSVETMWYDQPMGYHQPSVWQKDRMEEVYRWCPEYRMCTMETFTNHNTEDFQG